MTPFCHRHPSEEAHCFAKGKWVCLDCFNALGDFGKETTIEPAEAKVVEEAKASVALDRNKSLTTIVDGPNAYQQLNVCKYCNAEFTTWEALDMHVDTRHADKADEQKNAQSKTCSICGTTKPLDRFENDKRRPDGHGPRCRDCLKARRKKD